MDCQTALWMLVTAELCSARTEKEGVSQVSTWRRLLRAAGNGLSRLLSARDRLVITVKELEA